MVAKRTAAKAKRIAADWMPQRQAFDYVQELVGSADLALADIDAKVSTGEVRWATRTESQTEPIEQSTETWSTRWRLWPPPILAQPVDQHGEEHFVFFLRSDVLRTWSVDLALASGSEKPAPLRTGRPPKYDWQKFDVAVCRRIYTKHQGKIPEKPDPLMQPMRLWCQRNFKQVPDHGSIRKRIATVLKLLAE